MLTPNDDQQHRLRECEKAIESLTIIRDVVRQCCTESYALRGAREMPNFALARVEEKLARKRVEWERLKEMP
jgi:hypothetical protein